MARPWAFLKSVPTTTSSKMGSAPDPTSQPNKRSHSNKSFKHPACAPHVALKTLSVTVTTSYKFFAYDINLTMNGVRCAARIKKRHLHHYHHHLVSETHNNVVRL